MIYLKLTQAHTQDVWTDMVKNGYDNLGACLMPEANEDLQIVEREDIELDRIEKKPIVAVIGSAFGELRCYVTERKVFVAKDGTLWMDAEDFDEYFC